MKSARKEAVMSRTLIVAKMDGKNADAVKCIFAESDQSELPHILGVRERRLYRFHDLYFHCIDSDDELARPISEVRDNPLWIDINQRLKSLVLPYDPSTWRGPRDAMAEEFYLWRASR
jgi:cyclase